MADPSTDPQREVELAPGPRLVSQPRSHHSSLIALLDDPSPAIWEPVFRELRARGSSTLPALRWVLEDENPRLRARARALIASYERRQRLRRLINYAARTRITSETFHLERAMWLFSAIEEPRFDARAYQRTLDLLAEDALMNFASRKTGRTSIERAMALPDYMGMRFRFAVPRTSDGKKLEEDDLDRATHHPHNILLHRVLQRRSGLPLSIAIVWQLIATRLGAPMEIIGIPGHVLVRVPNGNRRILVDPAAGGRPVSRREVREYLEAYDVPFGPDSFEPLTPRGVMRRHIGNYMRGMGLRRQMGQAEELLTLHALFDE